MPVQRGKHEMNETDVACLWFDLETGDQMPAKLRLGRGGVWRLPPKVGGSQRDPLPRFTVLSEEQKAQLRDYFCGC